MLKLNPVSKEEFLKLVSQIPRGIGIEPSKETVELRKALESLKVGETLQIDFGNKKTVVKSVRNKNGILEKTDKTRQVDENKTKLEAGVRWYNKGMNDFIVMYKVQTGYLITKVSADTKKKYSKTIDKLGKDGKPYQVSVFNTIEWRKSQQK